LSFFEIFQPGLRHLREERDRQKTLVTRPTHGGAGGPLGIDLKTGKATFTMPPKAGSTEDAETEQSKADQGEAAPGDADQREAEHHEGDEADQPT